MPSEIISVSITGLAFAALLALSWLRGKRAGHELESRMTEQGWKVLDRERRWVLRGPYSFAAIKGVVFRIRACDDRGELFAGYACVSAGWDVYATERIEVLWDVPRNAG